MRFFMFSKDHFFPDQIKPEEEPYIWVIDQWNLKEFKITKTGQGRVFDGLIGICRDWHELTADEVIALGFKIPD